VLGCEVLHAGEPPQAPAEESLQAQVDDALADAGGIDAGVIDTAGLFASILASGAPGQERERLALGLALQASWNVTRALAGRAFIERAAPGRVLLLAPPAGAGAHAGPAAAGLENLARTLSTEWARYGITTVAIAPGADTGAQDVATVACYLLSDAGAYFSGCLLDLRGP